MSRPLDYLTTGQVKRLYKRFLRKAVSEERQGYPSLATQFWVAAQGYQDELKARKAAMSGVPPYTLTVAPAGVRIMLEDGSVITSARVMLDDNPDHDIIVNDADITQRVFGRGEYKITFNPNLTFGKK